MTTAAVIVFGVANFALGSKSGVGQPSAAPSPSHPAATATQGAVGQPSATPTSSGGPLARISVRHDGGLVFAYGSLWIGDRTGARRIDPATNTDANTILITDPINRLWDDGTSVIAWTDPGDIRIDPATNAQQAAGPAGMHALGAVWSIDNGGTLHKYDLATGQQMGTVSVQGAPNWQPQMTAGAGALWIAEGDTKSLVRVDPNGPKILTRITGFSSDDSLFVAGFAFNSVWVQSNAASGSGILYRIDPATNRITATIPVGDPAHSTGYGGTVLAFSSDSIWTGDSSGTVTRVDAATNKVVAVHQVEMSNVEWIAFGANSIWIRNQGLGEVQRYDAALWNAP
jgi:WD40 repeat protein